MNGEKLTSPCIAVVGGKLHLRDCPEVRQAPAGDHSPHQRRSPRLFISNALKGPHFTMFQIQALMEGKATLQGTGGHPGQTIAGPITIVVEARIVLPPPTSKEGMLARLFLAETPSPGMVTKEMAPKYTKANLVMAMSWMRVVLENRLAKPLEASGVRPETGEPLRRCEGSWSVQRISWLSGIARGYSRPHRRCCSPSAWAEDDDRRRASYKNFVEAALEVATMGKVTDPSARGLYWWRTKGSGSPADGVKVFGDKLGNTFYTR